ncbi:MAG TPA: TonB family protein [Terriglobales bacterium]|nr:TonB family protein [Terriglobales bacterium]
MLEDKPMLQPPQAIRLLTAADRQQRRKMILALVLLLVALGIVVDRNWSNWFGSNDTSAADWDSGNDGAYGIHKSQSNRKVPAPPKNVVKAATKDEAGPEAPPAVVNRTALPPLEVEVVAGGSRQTVRPGSPAVRLDMSEAPGSAPEAAVPALASRQPATNASERVRMSADTVHVVERPVQPSYPMLARQMKVQGSVMLQALIGTDGLIQELHVLSGPTILASAAEEAVRQWRFKPYLQNGAPVETEAKITVNFTISAL